MQKLWRGKLYIIFACSAIVLLIGCWFFPFAPSFLQTYFPAIFKTEDTGLVREKKCMQWTFCGIDSDSLGRCYVAFDTSVFVYSPQGAYLYRIQKPILGSYYDFSVENDVLCFWFARGNDVYKYSLTGTMLEQRPYEYEEKPQHPNFLEQRTCSKNGVLLYRYHSVLGFWWVTNSSKQIITHIPFFMYFIKLTVVLFLCCLIIIIRKVYMAFFNQVTGRKTGDGSLSWRNNQFVI